MSHHHKNSMKIEDSRSHQMKTFPLEVDICRSDKVTGFRIDRLSNEGIQTIIQVVRDTLSSVSV